MERGSDRPLSANVEAPGPVAVGGVGGSGTRLVAQVLRDAGFYVGADLNRSLDNLWFKVLFDRPRWLPDHVRPDDPGLLRGLDLFRRAMTGGLRPSPADLTHVARATYELAVHGHDIEGHGRGWWGVQRGRSLLAAGPPPEEATGWGWKEPSTLFVLEAVARHVPGVRYVHVLRHGLDVAFGANQAYPTWGPLLGIRPEGVPGPVASLRFWRLANERAVDTAGRLLGDDFLLVRYEDLCGSPRAEIERLLRFAGLDPAAVDLDLLSALPAPPPPSAPVDLSMFSDDDLAGLASLGYEPDPGPRVTGRRAATRPRASSLRVSVALCTYDGTRFLPELLESLAAQARPPDEVVVSDDGSTDTTIDLLESFAAEAPFPVRISRTPERLGSTKNFERAIGLCEGDVIFLADQDDVWMPTKLLFMTSLLGSEPQVGAVFCDADLIDERSRTTGHGLWDTLGFTGSMRRAFEEGRTVEVLLRGNVVTGAALAFRSRFRDLVLPIPAGWIQDAWIGLLVAAVSEIRMLPEPLIRYRLHSGQQIGVPEPLTQGQHLVRRAQLVRRMTKKERPILLEQSRYFREAHDRLAGAPDPYRPSDSSLSELAGKVAHLESRGRMGRGRGRVPTVVRELRAGRYRRYSNGMSSAAKDLFLLDRLGAR